MVGSRKSDYHLVGGLLSLKILAHEDLFLEYFSYNLILLSCRRGFARFVNVRDGDGATPLHLAAKQGWPNCLHILLDNGALVGASTGGYRRDPKHLFV